MQIYVDADACPVVDIVEKTARKYQIPVTLLRDTNHILTSGYSEVVVVGAGADAVDYKLISLCRRGGYCSNSGLWRGSHGAGQECLRHPPVR